MLEAIEEVLGGAGLSSYELTNYARPGFESRHNQRYWRREPVLGLGLGAWSTDPAGTGAPFGTRRQNTRALADYLSGISRCGSAEVACETLDLATARSEAVFLALRTREGLAAGAFRAEFGRTPRQLYGGEISRLVGEGLLEEDDDGDLRLSPRGRMLSDAVCACFVEAHDEPGIR
jgi:oxygen-independent coproporphyrinogen-3 oxidase